jgi:hypothetical protein
VSKTVLKNIPGGMVVSGASWLAGLSKELNADSLRSHILCKRHNECLSPLDCAAGKLFNTISNIYADLRSPASAQETSWYLVSGEMLELWGMKVMFGTHYSGTAAARGSQVRDSHSIDPEVFIQALSSKRLPAPCGLYCLWANRTLAVGPGVSVTPIGTANPPRIGGIQLAIHGIEFDIVFDPSAVNRDQIEGREYRPRYLNFHNTQRRHVVVPTWPDRPVLEPELEFDIH